jgi:redox-sensitive bicupin YhaK (pirin superfamily)
MKTQTATVTRHDPHFEVANLLDDAATAVPRRIAFRSSGRQQGPITRLVSPSEIGELIKPFVFLDHAVVAPRPGPLFGIHPHSGIATLTVVLRGGLAYEDTTGKHGEVAAGGLEWMQAGNGVWHDGAPTAGEPLRAFQLWVALPPSEENASPESQYIPPERVQEVGPVRVALGHFGPASSRIRAPGGINYFHVQLKDGQRWRYAPPEEHNVAWLAVDQGTLWSHEPTDAGQIAVFEESGGAIEVQADGDSSFVLGSAIKHPYPLVLGRYSVHTSQAALAQGEAEIRRIGERLRAAGRRDGERTANAGRRP